MGRDHSATHQSKSSDPVGRSQRVPEVRRRGRRAKEGVGRLQRARTSLTQRGRLFARAPAHLLGSAPAPPRAPAPGLRRLRSRSPTQRRWRRQQRRGPRGRSARALRTQLAHPGHRLGRPPAGLRWRRRQRQDKRVALERESAGRGHRRLASEPQTLARLAAGPWLPGALTCSQRTRGDAVTPFCLTACFAASASLLPNAAAAILCPGP